MPLPRRLLRPTQDGASRGAVSTFTVGATVLCVALALLIGRVGYLTVVSMATDHERDLAVELATRMLAGQDTAAELDALAGRSDRLRRWARDDDGRVRLYLSDGLRPDSCMRLRQADGQVLTTPCQP